METPALIREALATAGCSRAELARRARMPQSVLSAYEHGRREPSVASLNAVLAAAGLELGARRRLRTVDDVGAELSTTSSTTKRPDGSSRTPSPG